MTVIPETFRKHEKLCSRKAIGELFSGGFSFYCQPFQIIWAIDNNEPKGPARVAISVPKKNFKLAVQRNRIRRRIREAYRKLKHLLYHELETAGKRIIFIIIVKGAREPDHKEIFNSTVKIISRLSEQVKSAEMRRS